MKTNGADGWSELVAWFGCEPDFHDAEVVGIDLRVGSPSCAVRVHAWRVSAETDEHGHYRTDRHAIVTVVMEDVVSFDLRDWMRQNVLFDLVIEARDDGWSLTFDASCGLAGVIVAKHLRIGVEPYPA